MCCSSGFTLLFYIQQFHSRYLPGDMQFPAVCRTNAHTSVMQSCQMLTISSRNLQNWSAVSFRRRVLIMDLRCFSVVADGYFWDSNPLVLSSHISSQRTEIGTNISGYFFCRRFLGRLQLINICLKIITRLIIITYCTCLHVYTLYIILTFH
jgi:hypothetical protein